MAYITIQDAIKNMSFDNERTKGGLIRGRISYNGKQKAFYGKSKAECKNKATQYYNELETQKSLGGSDMTLNDLMEKWLEYKNNLIEASSISRLISVYKCQVKPSKLGSMRVVDITTMDIQALINEFANGSGHETQEERNERMKKWKRTIRENGEYERLGTREARQAATEKEENRIPLKLARSGLKRLKDLINPCMQYAVDNGIILKNPCKSVRIPKESRLDTKTKEQFALSDDELHRMKETALVRTSQGLLLHRNYIIFLLIVATGMRAGEISNLRWDDIDFEKEIIHISRTLQTNLDSQISKEYVKVKKGTKTNSGRDIPFSNSIRKCLDLLEEYDKTHSINSEYVACIQNGKREGEYQTPKNLSSSFQHFKKDAGLPENTSLHTLRHTFGSTALVKGVPIAVVSKLLGHANANVTYKHYTHIIQELDASSMKNIDIL